MWCRRISWLLLASCVAGQSCDEDVALHMLQRAAKASKPSKALPSGPCDAGGLGRPAPGAPCMPCAEGTWSSDGSCVKCRAGTWSDQRGAQSAATCQDCPTGTWSSQVGATALQALMGHDWNLPTRICLVFWQRCFRCLSLDAGFGVKIVLRVIVHIESLTFSSSDHLWVAVLGVKAPE